MAKYAFFSIPAHGHVLPTLPLVAELVSRGEHVNYYMTGEHKDSIEAAGARWHDFPFFGKLSLEDEERGTNILIESLRAEQTDFIIYDFFFIWGTLFARALQIPAINIRGTYANNRHFSMQSIHQHKSHIWRGKDKDDSAKYFMPPLYAQFARIGKFLNVPLPLSDDPFDVFAGNEALNIYMMSRKFQPYAQTFDERHVFVGSSIQSRASNGDFPFEALDGRPLLYIALGTLFNHRADIFKTCLKAFAQTSWQVVLSRGRQSTIFALGPVPANFLVVNYAPQLELLKRTAIFISHGGMNSTIESIMAGVPVIYIPQIEEQAINAENAEKFGLGIALNPENVTVDQLRDAVERITNSRAYYEENIQAMRSSIQSEGGYKRAVDAILSLNARGELAPMSSSSSS
ncbi:putative UDP-glucosyltransferase YojK [Dictyobacter vulcani]|uniref:Putative UDP-glucosyltransferase YojK n=1 Tax=Dictyobacter vulcani TaxID=2607529 RepID=A0A5J4KZ00_9CHLR|nr:macrolide family glycosyltransferase [Dictyobacter vulcani]GER91731.1 putative UDP-glucosyltransferase YojK [Dictyobacter vulcani]